MVSLVLAAQHDTQIFAALVPPPSLLHGAHGGADGAREDAGAVSGLVATLAFGAIGNSTKKAYLSKWKAWLGYRRAVGKDNWLPRDKIAEAVRDLTEYMTYRCLVERNQKSTIRGHLSAVKHYHKMYQGWEIPTGHWMIDEVLKGVDRAHGGYTTPGRGRRPLTWQLLREGQ